jgi:hypothetical protein
MLYEHWANLQKQNLSLPKLIDYAVRIPPEVAPTHYAKQLSLGPTMEKNLNKLRL